MGKMGQEIVRQQECGTGCPGCGEPTLPAGIMCDTCIAEDEYRHQAFLINKVLGDKLFGFGFRFTEPDDHTAFLYHGKTVVARFTAAASTKEIHEAAWAYLGKIVLNNLTTERYDAKWECPHLMRKSAGDVTYSFCEINDKPCLLDSGDKCDTWDEIKAEWDAEWQEEQHKYQ